MNIFKMGKNVQVREKMNSGENRKEIKYMGWGARSNNRRGRKWVKMKKNMRKFIKYTMKNSQHYLKKRLKFEDHLKG